MRTWRIVAAMLVVGCDGGESAPDATPTTGPHVRVPGEPCYQAWDGYRVPVLAGPLVFTTCDIACSFGPAATPPPLTGHCATLRVELQKHVVEYEGEAGLCVVALDDSNYMRPKSHFRFLPCDRDDPSWGEGSTN
jgi:hypothetical protein